MNSHSHRLEPAVAVSQKRSHLIPCFPFTITGVIVRMGRGEAEEALGLRIRGSKPDDFIVRETDKAGAK